MYFGGLEFDDVPDIEINCFVSKTCYERFYLLCIGSYYNFNFLGIN